jgi:ADP-heptose:LPS heptosyltransferase
MKKPLLFALRALGLGDFLVGVPAYRALRRAFPEHEFTLATTAGVAPLARLVGGIDGVTAARGPADFAAPRRPIDVAVNLHGRGPQSSAALRTLGPRRLIAFRGVGNDDPGAPAWADRWWPERDRWCELLRAFGIAADPDDLSLQLPAVEPVVRGGVVVHPGAAFGSRRWPPQRFAAVAKELTSNGFQVVICGSSAEMQLARAVATAAGLPPRTVLAGRVDVIGLAAVIAHAALVICGDTGPAHLATAYRTASVVLFGPTPPGAWGPPDDPRHVALWPSVTRAEPGTPWGEIIDPALDAITVRDVADAALHQLAGGYARTCWAGARP